MSYPGGLNLGALYGILAALLVVIFAGVWFFNSSFGWDNVTGGGTYKKYKYRKNKK
jgi:hypothetical protein